MKKKIRVSGFVAVLLLGAVAGAIWMRGDNRAREEYLDSQYTRLDKERDSATAMRDLGDKAFREYGTAVHEQSRVARNIQERLHEQELALVGAENGWIRLVIIVMAVTVLVVLWIARSTEDRARVTIQNAVGLPPDKMRGYLEKARMAEVHQHRREMTTTQRDGQTAVPLAKQGGIHNAESCAEHPCV